MGWAAGGEVGGTGGRGADREGGGRTACRPVLTARRRRAQALARYYREGNTSAWLRIGAVAPGSAKAGGSADQMLDHDIFTLSGVKQVAKIPRNADGGIDWYYKGPKSDPEFMNCLNRHSSFTTMLAAWQATGNPAYPTYFSTLVEDWVSHLPCRAGVSLAGWNASGSWNGSGTRGGCGSPRESPWRSLECGIRTQGPWPPAFFGFQQAEEFTVSARVLMLLGMSEHNAALVGPGQAAGTPNWAMAQYNGLLTSCVAFPELKNCSALLDVAIGKLETLMHGQVYPDGIETEEAFGYDMWTARDFFSTVQLMHRAGHAPPPKSFVQNVESAARTSFGFWGCVVCGISER